MNNDQNTPRRSSMRPWLKVVLALSLALNLAVIGIAAGAAWRYNGREDHHRGRPPMLSRFIFKDMGRQELRRLVKDHAGETGGLHSRRHDEMEQMIALMRAEELDTAAVRAIVEAHLVETNSFMRGVAEAWEQRLAGLPLKDRRGLADRMQHQLDHQSRHPKDPDRDH
jgi:uncharacterized membrane protein